MLELGLLWAKNTWQYTRIKPGGGNEGAIYKDDRGVEWLVKFSDNPRMICNEILANQLYKALGISVPILKTVNIKGRFAIASKMLPNPHATDTPAEWKLAWPGFAADVWLRNWDVGTYGNLITSAGKVYRIDTGGALVYRAMGEKKPGTYTDVSMSEMTSLRDPKMNRAGARVFGSMTDTDIKSSIKKVTSLSPDKLRAVIEKYWIKSEQSPSKSPSKSPSPSKLRTVIKKYLFKSEKEQMFSWLRARQEALKKFL